MNETIISVQLYFERSTKGTHLYKNEAEAINLYIPKPQFPSEMRAHPPKVIFVSVTLHDPEVNS